MTKVDRVTKVDLARQLSESLGQEKAEEVLAEAALKLGVAGDAWNRDETLRILELLAKAPGLVGIVARFAKVRVILQFK